jgi:two-component system, NtrC family, nitrogen regulation response regulator GlnG
MSTSPKLFPARPLLLVDDEIDLLHSFEWVLRSHGINHIVLCSDARQLEKWLAEKTFEGILLDLMMPGISGEDLLELIIRTHPEIPVLIATAVSQVETAVRCMQKGAFDYLVKPVDENRLVTAVRRILDLSALRQENLRLKQYFMPGELLHPEIFTPILTQDPGMHRLFRYVEAVATSAQPVLITGETGVGKELIARALHAAGNRPGEFVPVNLSGLDETVFSDSLFGHVKGAFTGAQSPRDGLVGKATEGTLFLDEIGDLSQTLQTKLLRFLQENEFFALGSDEPRRVDVRILVATNRNIQERVASGQFREDLYYRLMFHHVHVPPLRERAGDIPLLLEYFLDQSAQALNRKKPTPPRELVNLLSLYAFPGNVRELKAMVHDAVSNHSGGVLSMDSFLLHIQKHQQRPLSRPETDGESIPDETLFPKNLPTFDRVREELVAEALRRTNGNQSMAAQLLGVTRQTLLRYVREDADPSGSAPRPD